VVTVIKIEEGSNAQCHVEVSNGKTHTVQKSDLEPLQLFELVSTQLKPLPSQEAEKLQKNIHIAKDIKQYIDYFSKSESKPNDGEYRMKLNELYDNVKNCQHEGSYANKTLRRYADQAWEVYLLAEQDELGFAGKLGTGNRHGYHWKGEADQCDDYPAFLRCPKELGEAAKEITTLESCQNTFFEDGENVKNAEHRFILEKYLRKIGETRGINFDDFKQLLGAQKKSGSPVNVAAFPKSAKPKRKGGKKVIRSMDDVREAHRSAINSCNPVNRNKKRQEKSAAKVQAQLKTVGRPEKQRRHSVSIQM